MTTGCLAQNSPCGQTTTHKQEADEKREEDGFETYLLFLVFNLFLCISPLIVYLLFIAHWQVFSP